MERPFPCFVLRRATTKSKKVGREKKKKKKTLLVLLLLFLLFRSLPILSRRTTADEPLSSVSTTFVDILVRTISNKFFSEIFL